LYQFSILEIELLQFKVISGYARLLAYLSFQGKYQDKLMSGLWAEPVHLDTRYRAYPDDAELSFERQSLVLVAYPDEQNSGRSWDSSDEHAEKP